MLISRSTFWLFMMIAVVACRKEYDAPRPYTAYEQKQDYFKSVINSSEASENQVAIKDDNYPIEIRLYEDKRFYYNLPRLGDGWGTWKHRQGHLELYAERTLFVMQMQIRSTDPTDPEAIALEFSDRFGPKYLKMAVRESKPSTL